MSNPSDKPVIWWLPLGRRSYRDTWTLQKELLAIRRRHEVPDLFITVEHPHVVTIGRTTDLANVLGCEAPDGSGDVEVVEIERGGDVTYHGPGQLVGYFIFELEAHDRDLHGFLRRIEEVQLRLLAAFDLKGERVAGKTGVWVGPSKLGSVGIAVRNWVTYHGFALNASTDLRFFGLIHPCGMDAGVMSSVSELTGDTISPDRLLPHIPGALGEAFNREVIRVGEKRIRPLLAA